LVSQQKFYASSDNKNHEEIPDETKVDRWSIWMNRFLIGLHPLMKNKFKPTLYYDKPDIRVLEKEHECLRSEFQTNNAQ